MYRYGMKNYLRNRKRKQIFIDNSQLIARWIKTTSLPPLLRKNQGLMVREYCLESCRILQHTIIIKITSQLNRRYEFYPHTYSLLWSKSFMTKAPAI